MTWPANLTPENLASCINTIKVKGKSEERRGEELGEGRGGKEMGGERRGEEKYLAHTKIQLCLDELYASVSWFLLYTHTITNIQKSNGTAKNSSLCFVSWMHQQSLKHLQNHSLRSGKWDYLACNCVTATSQLEFAFEVYLKFSVFILWDQWYSQWISFWSEYFVFVCACVWSSKVLKFIIL